MKWLWIGDSHLQAMLPQIQTLSAAKGIGGSIYAHIGWSSHKWLTEGDAAGLIAQHDPDMVVYVLGTNDDPVSPAAVKGLVAAAGGRPVVWFGEFDTPAKDQAFKAILGSKYHSGAALAAGLPFYSGNVHLTAAGYKALAPKLVDAASSSGSWVTPLLAISIVLAAGIGLVAWGSRPVYEQRWKPGEHNPFDPGGHGARRASAKRRSR